MWNIVNLKVFDKLQIIILPKQLVSSSGESEYPVYEFKEGMKRKAVESTEDQDLANFFSGIHTLDNPEYAMKPEV